MRGEDLFDKMSLIDDELIEIAEVAGARGTETKDIETKDIETKEIEMKVKETDTGKDNNKKNRHTKNNNQKRKRLNWRTWSSLVACICFIIVSIAMVEQWKKQIPKDTQRPASDVESTGSISVPAIQLPKGDGAAYDMIGLIVYQGRIYTQVGWYQGEKAAAIKGLVGEHLGFAKGNIDEWSKQDDYAEEFAATAYGDVYAVNGYSTQFRICIVANDEMVDRITFYENLNGISLTTGADLFEERLKMQENWETVQYQTHESWNHALGNFNELSGITKTQVNEFFNELNSAEFHDMTGTDIYDWTDKRQTHLYVTLKDGTYIELRLLEGGYVGYHGLGWYFVKIPGSSFDSIFEACFQ